MAPKHPQLTSWRKRFVVIYALICGLFLLFFSSCGNQTITITQTDNGKAIQVHAGDTLVIQLDENASTGYTWAVNKIDTTILLLQSSTYTASGNLPGSAGTRVFASLAALGVKVRELKLFEPIGQRVKIAQKTVKDTPIDKLYDGWIAMLAGAHGLVEMNSRL